MIEYLDIVLKLLYQLGPERFPSPMADITASYDLHHLFHIADHKVGFHLEEIGGHAELLGWMIEISRFT